MYSPKIIEREVAALEQAAQIRLHRYTPEQSAEWVERLGQVPRPVKAEESNFIRNELLLSKVDFRYWADNRYVFITLDGGGAGLMKLRESQVLVLERYLSVIEQDMMDRALAGETVDGILFYWHKARQLYATTTARALIWHRALFRSDSRALLAVANEDQLTPSFDRDVRLYDNLPWWMRPTLKFDVKNEHRYLDGLNSSISYAAGNQKGGMGQGSQFELQHLTECAFWESPEWHVDYILKDTLPQSPRTLAIRESTANGRGDWWHNQTEDARHHRSNWGYVFIPWYTVRQKRRRTPPPDWTPDPISLRHADMVLSTSPEWVGRRVTLEKEQLYWWETERKEAQRKHALAMFYTNAPATPEESFQHHQKAAFDPEQIEKWRLGVSVPGMAVEVVTRG